MNKVQAKESFLMAAINNARLFQVAISFAILLALVFMFTSSLTMPINSKLLSMYSKIFLIISVLALAYYHIVAAYIQTSLASVISGFSDIIKNSPIQSMDKKASLTSHEQVKTFISDFSEKFKSGLSLNSDKVMLYSPFFIWLICSLLTLFICARVYFAIKDYEMDKKSLFFLSGLAFLNFLNVTFNILSLNTLSNNGFKLQFYQFYPVNSFTCGEFEFALFFISIFLGVIIFRRLSKKTYEIEIDSADAVEISDSECCEESNVSDE